MISLLPTVLVVSVHGQWSDGSSIPHRPLNARGTSDTLNLAVKLRAKYRSPRHVGRRQWARIVSATDQKARHGASILEDELEAQMYRDEIPPLCTPSFMVDMLRPLSDAELVAMVLTAEQARLLMFYFYQQFPQASPRLPVDDPGQGRAWVITRDGLTCTHSDSLSLYTVLVHADH